HQEGRQRVRRVPRRPALRVVLQRVSRASVTVRGEAVASIGGGYVLLVGVGADDAEGDAERLAEKIFHLRVFEDDEGKMNRWITVATRRAAGIARARPCATLPASRRRSGAPSSRASSGRPRH